MEGTVDVRSRDNKRMGKFRVDQLHHHFQSLMPKKSKAYQKFYSNMWDPTKYESVQDEAYVSGTAVPESKDTIKSSDLTNSTIAPPFTAVTAKQTPKYIEICHKIIQVKSAGFTAGNHAEIKFDNIQIPIKPNKTGHHRGLNIVVINPKDGIVVDALAFDTYHTSEYFESWIAEKCYKRYKNINGSNELDDFEMK